MGTHTPGPWSWWDSCSFRRLSARNDGDVLHAVIQHSDGHPDIHFPNGGYTGPDARLIAAAPDLLTAAIEAMAVMDDIWDTKDADDEFIYDEMGSSLSAGYFSLRAAIAKATGATP